MPDGLEDLADHNLLTYKSHHEALSDWSLKELTGHYVNYRKQVSPGFDDLLQEDRFRLYAVCARFPQKLSAQLTLTALKPGVYNIQRGTDCIRLIVLSEVAEEEHTAPLHLFSAVPDIIRYGADHFEKHSTETSTLINRLFSHYEIEGVEMPYTMADFRREIREEVLSELTPEERLKGLPPEERLKGLPPEERLKGLPPEERLKGVPPEERLKGLTPEQIVRSLSPDALREVRRELDQLQEEGNGERELKD